MEKERTYYDENKLRKCAFLETALLHPDWDRVKIEEVAYSKEMINILKRRALAVDLKYKLKEDDMEIMPDSYYEKQAKWIVENIPNELILNVNEYIEGKNLSRIKIHGVSVDDIMTQYPNRKIFFAQALKCIIAWKKQGYQNDSFRFDYFALR